MISFLEIFGSILIAPLFVLGFLLICSIGGPGSKFTQQRLQEELDRMRRERETNE